MSDCKHVFFLLCVTALAGCAGEAPPGLDDADTTATVESADTVKNPSSVEPLAYGAIVATTFTGRDKYRAFIFAASKDQQLDLYVDGLRGLDTVLSLYRTNAQGRPTGRALASNDDTGNAGWTLSTNKRPNAYSSSLSLAAPATGTYALVATTYRQRGSGAAEVLVKTPYKPVRLDQLATTPESFEGQPVMVTAQPVAGPPRCTKMACPSTSPCCNACSTGFRIGGDIELVGLSETLGCSGDSCNPAGTCTGPFTGENRDFYVLKGVFARANGAATFTLESATRGVCQRGGCSGQLCVREGGPGGISTCEYRPQYACFETATCLEESNGACGWDGTNALEACLESHR